jgi:hypothetical protein
MAYQLSVGRVWKRDWPSFVLVGFTGCLWLMVVGAYLLLVFRFPDDHDGWRLAHLLSVIVAGITLLCGSIIILRLRTIRRVFRSGEVVHGRVESIGENSEDIGYAQLAYQYQARDYQTKNVTEAAAERGKMKPGDNVAIVVDPSKPSRAFVVKLFVE